MDVAHLIHRDNGNYPAENCLVCGQLVNTEGPHVFVRDVNDQLSDAKALVGLLHLECEDRYLEEAAAAGVELADNGE